jgi:hypothetical protein
MWLPKIRSRSMKNFYHTPLTNRATVSYINDITYPSLQILYINRTLTSF